MREMGLPQAEVDALADEVKRKARQQVKDQML